MACSSPTSIYLSGLSAYFISKLAYLQTRNICPICLTAKKIIFKLSTGIWIDTRPAFFIQHFEKTQGPKTENSREKQFLRNSITQGKTQGFVKVHKFVEQKQAYVTILVEYLARN